MHREAPSARRSISQFTLARGTLTNWKTISGSIKRLRHLDEVLNSATQLLHQEGTADAAAEPTSRSLAGRIKEMGVADMIFVDRHQQGRHRSRSPG